MKLLSLLAAIASVSVAAAPAAADPGATTSVSFNSSATTATLTSSKGITKYSVRLCSGPGPQNLPEDADDDADDDARTLAIGPFGSPIVSVTVTSGRSVQTFASGVSCEPGTEVPEAASPLLLPLSILGTLGLAGAFAWHRRRGLTPP
jgi:hypothetical protein